MSPASSQRARACTVLKPLQQKPRRRRAPPCPLAALPALLLLLLSAAVPSACGAGAGGVAATGGAAGRPPHAEAPPHAQRAREAFVTLLYGDEFLLGVRVLGQSLRETGTTRDLVVLAAGPVTEYAQTTLEQDGWRVQKVDVVMNPSMRDDGSFPPRFWAVYSKLHVFGMVEYTTVVFMDADTVAVRNIDELFLCPGFCATLRHSERFNSGVMVIHPTQALFREMSSSMLRTPSYTGGDQGFLNEYFTKFSDGPLFNPTANYNHSELEFLRLPTNYNADIGLFILNGNHWMLSGHLKVVHYTLGTFKPWAWWCGWLIEEQSRWNSFRMHLGADAQGRKHGISPAQGYAQSWMIILPPLVLIGVVRCMLRGWPTLLVPIMLYVPPVLPPSAPRLISVIFGHVALLVSVTTSVLLIPTAVTPSWGWILCYEYTFTIFFLLYAKFLHVVWVAGRSHAGHSIAKVPCCPPPLLDLLYACGRCEPRRPGGHVCSVPSCAHWVESPPARMPSTPILPWAGTMVNGGILLCVLTIAPFVYKLVHAHSLLPKTLATVAGVLVANSVSTVIFADLAVKWFNNHLHM